MQDLRQTVLYKMDFIIYTIWPEMSEWAHKPIREEFTKVRPGGCFPIDFYRAESLLQPQLSSSW